MSNFNRNDLPDNKGAIFEHWDAELDFFYEDKILRNFYFTKMSYVP